MALTLTNDILKFRESTSDPWEKLLIQANINFNLIYPVGSIYMSTVNVDPGTIFGGTWERLKDRFLLGAGDTYTAGDTGGEATHAHTTGNHTLTINEIPSHTHYIYGGNNNDPPDWFGGSGNPYGILQRAGTTYDYLSYTGDGQAHNHGNTGSSSNMPPYLVVYMWRRLTLSPTIYTPPANVLIGEVASEDIVPIAKGGTGANNAAGAIANLGFDSGTSYCKLPDGTLMEWGTTSLTSGSTSAYVSPINIATVTIQFPIPFASTDYWVFGSGKYSTGASTPIGQTIGGETLTACSVHWWDAAARTFSESVPLVIKWCAIGRWK